MWPMSAQQEGFGQIPGDTGPKLPRPVGTGPALVEIQCHCWSSAIPSRPKLKWRHIARATWKNQRMSILLCLHLRIIGGALKFTRKILF